MVGAGAGRRWRHCRLLWFPVTVTSLSKNYNDNQTIHTVALMENETITTQTIHTVALMENETARLTAGYGFTRT
jgi:hypothetical protein